MYENKRIIISMDVIMKNIRIIDLVHLFIYLMIFIVLSNWFINYVLIILNIIVMFIYYFYCIRIISQKRKDNRLSNKENKKLLNEYIKKDDK